MDPISPTDPEWFRTFVERCRQRRSLSSVQEWVAAHINHPAPAVASKSTSQSTGRGGSATARVQYSSRNDVRTSAGASGAGVDISFPPGSSSIDDYNIFANIALHDQAAATIVSASQRKSGFTATMSTDGGEATSRFVVYLLDFIAAPHWLLSHFNLKAVTHQTSNHSKFVEDLVSVVVEGLQTVGGDKESLQKAEVSVRSLAQRLSSMSSQEEMLTLFSNFWMNRPNLTDPVVYGIFYITLHARYIKSGKTQVLSVTTDTFTVIFSLVSGVLIANEKAYNALYKTSVDDWLAGHTI